MSWQQIYLERYYQSRPGWMSGTEEFHDLFRRHVPPGSRILEVGPGAGGQTSVFLAGFASDLVGLDVDDDIFKNPYLKQAMTYGGQEFPFEDQSFHAVVSDYVLEHVEKPSVLFKEIRRVLKPGGHAIFRTPNHWHYVGLLGYLLPDRFSVWARNRAPDHRVYPRFLRCNTERACRRILGQAGLEIQELCMLEKEPSYGLGSRFLFFLMMAYERLVNSSPCLKRFRANILCAARRPEE